jgi:hypothetical protein
MPEMDAAKAHQALNEHQCACIAPKKTALRQLRAKRFSFLKTSTGKH